MALHRLEECSWIAELAELAVLETHQWLCTALKSAASDQGFAKESMALHRLGECSSNA